MFRAETEADLDRGIPALRRRLRRSYALSPENAFEDARPEHFHEARRLHDTLHRAWQGGPMGRALEVASPRAGKPNIHQRVDRASA